MIYRFICVYSFLLILCGCVDEKIVESPSVNVERWIPAGVYTNYYRASDRNGNVNNDLLSCGAYMDGGEVMNRSENSISLSKCMLRRGYRIDLPPRFDYKSRVEKSAEQEKRDFLSCGGKFHSLSKKPIVDESNLVQFNNCMAKLDYELVPV